ncbi:universal stress protein [Arthrobacter bambusae]|uniref:universal stress protein n=1 Tax=Arthrobacter bambusae TaxID=1338426 RepID=UPI002780B672|nr:universal stress protein [Arthrobacter bambusae]MDQ0028677.1 nucleotide-binding universal stress UspA family protein [Arthrobacter bambusae]MDQ0096529.1 nucleotide-binding universal stress UspA family protein [Arthrobacter bambusae]
MKKILVGVDGSVAGGAAADWAAERARDLGLQLNLVHAVPEPWAFPEKALHTEAIAQAKDLLKGETARIAARFPSLEVLTTLSSGEPAETMRKLSAGAEMVVVGTDRRPGNHGEGFGSVSFQIAVISHCVVAVVPAPSARDSSGVVVGVDGSRDSEFAVEYAADEAERMGEVLAVVHAGGGPGPVPSSSGRSVRGADPSGSEHLGHGLLSESVRRMERRHPGLVIRGILDLERAPAEVLLDASARARLLVMGCKGRGGARVLVGSVAQHVLLNVQCPTLITRPDLQAIGQDPRYPG